MVLQRMIQAVGYIRKSPDEKDSRELSLVNQEAYIKRTCDEKVWELVELFIDANITGSDRDRKAFNQMLKFVKGKFKENPDSQMVIVVKDQDRFARDSSYFRDTLKDLEVRKIKVYSILKRGFLSWEDIGDNIIAVVNQQLVITGKQKAELTIELKKENSLPSIPAPFGYKYKSKNWVVDSKKAEIIKGIFDDYLNKVPYKETLLKYKINRTKRDRIISNIKKGVYSGLISFEKKFKDSSGEVIRTEKIEYRGNYEPIISEEIWSKLNEPK